MTRWLTEAPQDGDRDDMAAYWMARLMSGEMTTDERGEMRKWSDASPENAAAIGELENMLGALDSHSEHFLAEEYERELEDKSTEKARRTPLFRNIAASAAIAAAASVMALFILPKNGGAPQSYQTAVGQFQEIELEDGSEIELNTASLVRVAYDGRRRAVGLEQGEAFFNVEKDKARPFVVMTNFAEIAVTGTSFSVANAADRSSIHVLTGVVDVKPLRGQSSTLLAGDMIEVGADGVIGRVTRYDPALALAWRSGKARFREAPLGEALVTLNRYFDTPIVLADDRLSSLPVTGEFDIRDSETAVKALSLAFGLESRADGARIVLDEKSAE